MFGSKVVLTLDKATAIASIGLVVAMCACVMLKSGLENLINGSNQNNKYARTKGTVLTTIALVLLTVGLATILESDLVLKLLSKKIKLVMATFLA
ncbi:MAG TPA: hypothetical protein VLG71_02545 [Candidatus Limnocylindria bacterium]|nr:hypothetical protein [Candidatus Limnocylindria bacterium]